jgi:hypothetical protein
MKTIQIVITCIVLGSSTTPLFAIEDLLESIKLEDSLNRRFEKNLSLKGKDTIESIELEDSLNRRLEVLSLKGKDTIEITTKFECEKFLQDTGADRFIDSNMCDWITPLYELCKTEKNHVNINEFITTALRGRSKRGINKRIESVSAYTQVEDIVALTLYCAEYWAARNVHVYAGRHLLNSKEAKALIRRTFLLNSSVGYRSLLIIIYQVTTNANLNTLIRLCEITFLDKLILPKCCHEFREIKEAFSNNLTKFLVLAFKYKNKDAMRVFSAVAKKFKMSMPSKTTLKKLAGSDYDERLIK